MEWIWEIIVSIALLIIGLLIYFFRVPRISTERDGLIIQHSIVYRMLTLFLNIKKTTIDRSHQMVVMDRRIMWICSNQKVLYFENLDHIDFAYKNTDLPVGDPDTNTQTSRITYGVSLVDKDHVKHDIFSFKSSNVTGSVYGDSGNTTYLSSTYGDEARNLVDLLKVYTGLDVGNRVYKTQNDTMNTCPHCGQKTSKKKSACLYCGKHLSS